MSRVGKKPIPIPDKTKITYEGRLLTVKGDKGTLSRSIPPAIDLQVEDNVMNVTMVAEDRTSRALQGLVRSLVNNMIVGVNNGFEKVLEINGIGYRAEAKSREIVLHVGYSKPVTFALPKGISAVVEKNNIIKLSGIDKEEVGRTAAAIRQIRPPEPYKAKGIKYIDEHIRRKAGKTGTK